jgi:hypothetical protein
MGWPINPRPAKSLVQLLAQVNRASPARSKVSDGLLGDAAHASRSSDHNPWFKDSQGVGVVSAIDITHDVAHGVDGAVLSRALIKDTRVKYVIFNSQIWKARTGDWEVYRGSNKHAHHVHVSVKQEVCDQTQDWPWPPLAVKTSPQVIGAATLGSMVSDTPPPAPVSAEDPAKGVTTSDKPASETAGTPPPAPAAEVKASEVSLWTRITSISIPGAVITAVGSILTFAKELPPYAWIALAVIVVVAMVIGYLVWSKRDDQAHERTKIVLHAAEDPTKNNLRLV